MIPARPAILCVFPADDEVAEAPAAEPERLAVPLAEPVATPVAEPVEVIEAEPVRFELLVEFAAPVAAAPLTAPLGLGLAVMLQALAPLVTELP